MSNQRKRFSKIPMITRKQDNQIQALLRYQPHWKIDPENPRRGVWYWPSVTQDENAPSLGEFLDALSAEFELERNNSVWRDKQIWAQRC